jgi:hypothetical protein
MNQIELLQSELTELTNVNSEAPRLTDLQNFFVIYNNLTSFERSIINECVNTNRPMNLTLTSRKDVSDKLYANTEKNSAIYGIRSFQTVTEEKTIIGTVNYIYENSVNNQQERETSEHAFIVQPRKWGIRINKAIVIHKGKIYLSVKFGSNFGGNILTDENGLRIQQNEYDTWTKQSSKTSYKVEKTQERQEVDEVVIVNDYCIENVIGAKINGVTYSR